MGRTPEEIKQTIAMMPTKADKVQQSVNGWKGINIIANGMPSGKKMSAIKCFDRETGEYRIYNIIAPVAFNNLAHITQSKIVYMLEEEGRYIINTVVEIDEQEMNEMLMLIKVGDMAEEQANGGEVDIEKLFADLSDPEASDPLSSLGAAIHSYLNMPIPEAKKKTNKKKKVPKNTIVVSCGDVPIEGLTESDRRVFKISEPK
jgi:hypothetical protein